MSSQIDSDRFPIAEDTGDDFIDYFQSPVRFTNSYTEHPCRVTDVSRGIRNVIHVQRWSRQKELGRGGFGTVYLESERGGLLRAVKEVPKRSGRTVTMDYLREILTMAHFSKQDAFLVRFECWYQSSSHIYLAMEYFPNGDLINCVEKPLPELEVRIISYQLLAALQSMHQKNFAHRDLNPSVSLSLEGFAVPEVMSLIAGFRKILKGSPGWWVKVGDFGVSKRVKHDSTSLHTTIEGQYSAPEMVFGMEDEASSYTSAVDMWSLGYLIHWLLTGNLPLSKRELLPFYQKRIPLPKTHLTTHRSSAEAIEFICKLLERQPRDRLTASEGLRHAWPCNPDNTSEQESGPDHQGEIDLRSFLVPAVNHSLKTHETRPESSRLSTDPSTSYQSRTKSPQATSMARNLSDERKTRNNQSMTGSVFCDEGFVTREQELLPHSSLAVSALAVNGTEVILDTTSYPEEVDKSQTTSHVRDLARILFCSRPSTLGLLQCIGVLKELDANGKISQYRYVFLNPTEPHTASSSLRALLLRGPVSLDAKYRIAKSITRGTLAVHAADFVHKSIRPENILVFSSPRDHDIRAYLVGFERTRPAASGTSLTGDMIWERNLYRHPSRQGIKPMHAYVMQHDIYSLGVCLLEIGLWNSLVVPSDPPLPGRLLHIDEQLSMRNSVKAAWEIKGILIHMARTFLPSLMGLLYTEVVLSCLTCLNSGTTNMFANEKDLYDEDGILVGVVFIEKILSRLESISI